MKEEFEFTVGPNGNKKEEKGTEEKVKQCYDCNNYNICTVKEQIEKLVNCWTKVSIDFKNVLKIYNEVASDCKCYIPLKDK